MPAFFEADEMAIGVGGQIIVGENKSWPVVDGKPTDEDALGAALDQAATYVLLGRRTLEHAGVDPACMSDSVVLAVPISRYRCIQDCQPEGLLWLPNSETASSGRYSRLDAKMTGMTPAWFTFIGM